MYFDPTFDISSSATWASILDSQDELSTHLDTLESHLIHEITLRSTSFFSALSNLQDLHSESASCLAHITDLQESLKEVGEKQARKGLQIIDQHEELRLLRGVDTGVREIGEAQQAMVVAQGLVDGGDWAGAIGCLDDVVNWWGKHAPSQTGARDHLPLASLTVLSSLPEQFSNMKISIAAQLESALSALLSSILSRVEDSDTFDEEIFRSSVEPMLSGLTRCGSSDKLQDIWREAVTVSIREGSRRVSDDQYSRGIDTELLSTSQSLLQNSTKKMAKTRNLEGMSSARVSILILTVSMNLAQSLRSMDHSRYLLLATEMYTTLLSRLHLVQRIGDALSQMLERDE
jgi:vacuolar protein sorting-associated protein 54